MNGKIYASSDHHFGHANIIKYCNREAADISADCEEMIKNHNQVVTNQDLWICVGDIFCSSGFDLEQRKSVIKRLNAKYKILIKGNHDFYDDQYYLDLGFDEVANFKVVKVNTEARLLGDKASEQVYVFYHYPEIPDSLDLPADFILVHGHTHKVIHIDDKQERINVCIDVDPIPYRIA